MARPPRLELPDSWHYVSNTSALRQHLFRTGADVQAFLLLLAETSARFGARWHGFSLLEHSYHLLVHTPEPNLQRIMRHINGVYTQHYQRAHKRSGPLFQQRYKSLLTDMSHALSISHHIHRLSLDSLPLEEAENSIASSLRFYTGADRSPDWFSTALMEGLKGRPRRNVYLQHLMDEAHESFEDFILRHRHGNVLGDETLRHHVHKLSRQPLNKRAHLARPDFRRILRQTATHFGVRQRDLMVSTRGRGVESPARSVAMYLCQVVGGMTLAQIAESFSLASYASAGSTIRNVRKRMNASQELSTHVRTLETSLKADRH